MQTTPRSSSAPATNDGQIPTQTSQDMEDFIYLISHDVRSSVRALLELPQWIVEDLEEAGVKADGQVASTIALMNRHTHRLDQMLVDLLTFSRIGRIQSVGEINLDAVLGQVLAKANFPQEFVVTRDLACQHMTIGECDALTLLDALLTNAVKHHDKASGRVVVSSRFDGKDIVLSVYDDGPGIIPDFHERVFFPMTTLRPRDEIEGSGMGLAMVRKIATHYGGDVRVQQSPFETGTNIVMTLPSGVSPE